MDSHSDDTTRNPSDGESENKLKEPHLLDFGSLIDIAQWIAQWIAGAAGGGVVSGVAYDVVKNFKNRMGGSRVPELRGRVLELIDESAAGGGGDKETLKEDVDKLFQDFQ